MAHDIMGTYSFRCRLADREVVLAPNRQDIWFLTGLDQAENARFEILIVEPSTQTQNTATSIPGTRLISIFARAGVNAEALRGAMRHDQFNATVTIAPDRTVTRLDVEPCNAARYTSPPQSAEGIKTGS
jgi:hypothetical protein